MPNLLQIQNYHKKYKPNSALARIDNPLEPKGLPLPTSDRFEKSFQNLASKLGIEYEKHFELGIEAEVVMVYIDICSFSKRFATMPSGELSIFLDKYYEKVIPIIYNYDGEIERIMGDGIIAIFGPPFCNKSFLELVSNALICSLEVLSITNDTDFYSKIALHSGDIKYYKNKITQYPDYTIIGKPLTELYRLESIASDKEVVFYSFTNLNVKIEKMLDMIPDLKNHIKWFPNENKKIEPPLKGVDFKYTKSISL
ncbi:adenylate/guanylate cyclase domain-containing protein [Fibrella forsythiae]|uniref:Adenylate/guanylate cyclase domain-containing protein n=1 Tax=Fibrella forsythiae TaxID=2817061 RepID=A0ABS3JBA0_9BACT|nr:adenylate/guanylate cyclase domain-containing protein [Fibrella forsythiae]MBO0947269.1 adenylate/guanylate cyclase domain-containing protein [Fibrella forsythiae]